MRFSHIHGLLLQQRNPLRLIDRQVLPTPVLVDLRVKLQLPHAQTAQEPRDRDAKHDLPDDLECGGKGVPHLVLERLLQRRDDRNRRERDLDALWELREEGGG